MDADNAQRSSAVMPYSPAKESHNQTGIHRRKEVENPVPDHFTEETLGFLAQAPLQDKAWLNANRSTYQEHCVAPFKGLLEALTPAMTALDPRLEGTLSRIYRDMRFSRGPALHESVWLCFQDRSLPPEERPAFFFEVYANRYRYGMGFYTASRQKMAAVRLAIDTDPTAFAALVAALPVGMQVLGERYKQSRAGHLPEALATWYDRKSFWVQTERPADSLLFSDSLAGHVAEALAGCVPLYRFLRDGRPSLVVK
jgi:uncharacterized protein (DUF2461 family)